METNEQYKAMRLLAGMTKAKWADALGVEWITVYRWEKGETKPHASAVKLMEALSQRIVAK